MDIELNKIYKGHVLDILKSWPDSFIDCVVTSPPYLGLRDYNLKPVMWPALTYSLFGFDVKIPEWLGQLGLEPSPEMFVGHIIMIFREIKRVMKKDGTLWLNFGDSYWGGKGFSGCQSPDKAANRYNQGKSMTKKWQQLGGLNEIRPQDRSHRYIKPKDMTGIPWMVAFALRDDGWYLRQDIIWGKSATMPESVKDRCTRQHEYIFLLTKSRKYYFDTEAIKENASENSHERISRAKNGHKSNPDDQKNGIRPRKTKGIPTGMIKSNESFDSSLQLLPLKRNKRSIWMVNPEQFFEAHFATFPQKLIVDCIKAGSSEYGCCMKCGKPYTRVLIPTSEYARYLGKSYMKHDKELDKVNNLKEQLRGSGCAKVNADYETVGWEPDCNCNTGIKHALVCDPFSGSGTTFIVSRKLNRDVIAIEMNDEYINISDKRIYKELGMFK